jgi:hypothetical protein
MLRDVTIGALLGGFGLASLLILVAEPAEAQCAKCTTETTCELVEESWAAACRIVAPSPCDEEGVCVYVDPCDEGEEGCSGSAGLLRIGVDPQDLIQVEDHEGTRWVVPVGDDRYAAWDCRGKLIRLFERAQDGRIVELPAAAYSAAYNYWAVLARRGTQAAGE